MPHAKFVVLTSSRTGSTWLIDLLNSQAGVDAHGELFLGQPRQRPAIAGRSDYRRFIEVHGTPGWTRVSRTFSYLNELYRPPRAVGFKLMYTQLRRQPAILAYLALRHIRVVHLTRLNHLDAIVSEELARLTGVSHVPAGTSDATPKVYVDPATLMDRLCKRSRRPTQSRLLMRLAACPTLEVTYEALLEGDREFLRIFEFLDIPRPISELRSRLAKRGTRSHREAIVNYEEVRQILGPTRFSTLLR